MPLTEVELEYQALLCRKSAMRFENISRRDEGEPVLYGEKEFDELAEKFRALKTKVAAPLAGSDGLNPSNAFGRCAGPL